MLDQNTDRMWYVIGAVLIGAAVILIANGSMPQLFASVTNSFSEVTDEVVYSPIWTPTFAYSGDSKGGEKGNPRAPVDIANAYEFNPTFGDGAHIDPNTNVYIVEPFNEADSEFMLEFEANRWGYMYVTYEFYFGETLVDRVAIGGEKEIPVSITGQSPENLADENYITIRTTYPSPNSFWVRDVLLTKG